jgi:protein-tyrosine phosphatase
MAVRDLAWDGCLNVRDLGGLPTEDGGETRFGSVIRADSVGLLTQQGWEELLGSGVTRIVNLRSDFEMTDDPDREPGVEFVHVPIFLGLDDDHWNEVQSLSEGASTHGEAQRLVYLHFLEHCRPQFVAAVEAVAQAPAGAVVVHCHGGKDRTGIVVALLLRLAGVPIDTVAEDYALSGERLQPRHEAWLATAADDAERARIERISSTPYEAMHGVLEAVDERYGGVEQYLLDGGLSQADVAAARARVR